MKNKKGASHVDWVISMGIFLIYVIALFVFLRPGVGVEHKPQAMLDLLEGKIKDEIYVNLKETPFYVKTCIPPTPIPPETATSRTIKVKDINNNWNVVRFIDELTKQPAGKLGGGGFEITCDNEDYITEADNRIFKLVLLPNNKESGVLSLERTDDCEQVFCEAELHSTENKVFVFDDYVTDLKDKIYEDVKDEFGFPESREFAVYFLKDREKFDEDKRKEPDIGSKEKRPEQSNTYIIEWKDNYIDSVGYVAGEIVIHIEAW